MRSCTLGCLTTGLLLVVLAVGGFGSRGLWLPLIGRALDVPADLHHADVIVVLGGGNGDRARYAGELYRQGLASHVIATGAPLGTDTGATDLVKWGIPRPVIVLANGTMNTRDDAMRTRQIMTDHGWTTALLVTDPYHIRRSLATFRSVFAGRPIQVSPAPVADGWFDADHWWQSEDGFVAVMEEYLKLGYYLARGYVRPSTITER